MNNLKSWIYKTAILGMALFLVGVIGILKVEAATSIDDAVANTSVDVEATSDTEIIPLATAASEGLTITNTSNVEIGTTSPSALSEVNEIIKADEIQAAGDELKIDTGTANLHVDGTVQVDPSGTQEVLIDTNELTLKSDVSVNEFPTDGNLAVDSVE